MKPKQWLLALVAILPLFAHASNIEKLDIEFDFFADEEGAEKVYVAIAIPEKDLNGNVINKGDIARLDVYRKYENFAFSVDNPTPGDVILHVDEGVKQGTRYTYYIKAITDEGTVFNIQSYRVIYVGFDRPTPVTDLTSSVSGQDVSLEWVAPAGGYYDGVLNRDELCYDVVRSCGYDSLMVAEGLRTTEFIDHIDADELVSVKYTVTPRTSIGKGGAVTTPRVLVGETHKLPFVESFAGGLPSHDTWVSEDYWYYDDKFTYNPITNKPDVKSCDNDGGMLNIAAYCYGMPVSYRIVSAPIRLEGCADPTLEFYYYAIPGRNLCKLNVNMYAGDSTTPLTLGTIDYSGNLSGWQVVHIPLATTAPIVKIEFEATAGVDNLFAIDRIRIGKIAGGNLAVTGIKVPSRCNSGDDAEVLVDVANNGLEDASGYTLTIFRDDAPVKVYANESLAKGMSKRFVFSDPVTNAFGESVSYRAAIDYADDQDLTDNESDTATMEVTLAALPFVSDLRGEYDEATRSFRLSWSEPDYKINDVIVRENFEAYDNYTISQFGDWTVWDKDGQQTYSLIDKGLRNDIKTYPDYHSPKAFQLFDAGYIVDQNTTYPWRAHSGNKVIASLAPYYGAKDDWLISPELSGDAQSIEFFTMAYNDTWGTEQIFVYGSKSGIAEADFDTEHPLLCNPENRYEGYEITNTVCKRNDYQRIEVELPKGTKHFAIRVATPSNNAFLLIDDVTFSAARDGIKVRLLGYNVYCDGVKVNDAPITAKEMVLTDIESAQTCHVCAVYDKGESEPSNVLDLPLASIDTLFADDNAAYDVFDLNGIAILHNATRSDLTTLRSGIYIVNGHKILLK